MASVANQYHERRTHERRRIAYPGMFAADGARVSWGGILGGVLVAVGVLVLLMTLGVAVGITAVDPASTEAAKLGTGAGIYAGISLLIALFVGGMVATRIGATTDRTTAFFSGFLVWVVSILLMTYLATSGVSSLAGGAFQLFASNPQAQEQAATTLQQKAQELQQKAPQLQQKAQELQPQASRAAWITFGSLVLSLVAAIVGAVAGRRRGAPVQPTSKGT